jgi:hypothetical protein
MGTDILAIRGWRALQRKLKSIDGPSAVWLAGYLVLFSAASFILGGDGTPDFKIYHYYNGYAAISGGRPQDIAAAQLQTYYFPGADALYFCLIQWLNGWPGAAKLIFALPNVIAAYLSFRIAERVIPKDWPLRKLMAGGVAIYGCIGAATLPTMGTSMSELVAGVFVLVAILSWLSRDTLNGYVAISLAAVSCGIAVGLKLTCVPMFIGVLAGIGASHGRQPGIAARHCLLFGALGALASLSVAGWWWLHIYSELGNPIFPAFNDLFQSEMIDTGRWADNRFKPAGWVMTLFYPVYWAFEPTTRVIELSLRDSRILIGLAASLVILGRNAFWLLARSPFALQKTEVVFLAMFYLVSYVLWELLFSVYRYLSVLETLSGVMAISAIACIMRRRFSRVAILALAVLLVLSASTTIYPWWSRSTSASQFVEAAVPAVPADSMILMLDPYAMSYLVPFFPASVRVIGANTNLVRPGSVGRLQKNIEAAINGHTGPLWGLENPRDFPGTAEATLKYYQLERADACTAIMTNIDEPNTIACRLVRLQDK